MDTRPAEVSLAPWYFSGKLASSGLGDLFDLENSLSNHNKAVELTADGHPIKALRLSHLANSQEKRFERLGNLPDLENCLSNREKAVELTVDGHPRKATMLYNLGLSQETRFKRLSDLSDLETPSRTAKRQLSSQIKNNWTSHCILWALLVANKLASSASVTWSDIENTISNIQKAVELTADANPSESMYLLRLGTALKFRFRYLDDLDDLAACVSFYKAAAQTEDSVSISRSPCCPTMGTDVSFQWRPVVCMDGYPPALELFAKGCMAWLKYFISPRSAAPVRILRIWDVLLQLCYPIRSFGRSCRLLD